MNVIEKNGVMKSESLSQGTRQLTNDPVRPIYELIDQFGPDSLKEENSKLVLKAFRSQIICLFVD